MPLRRTVLLGCAPILLGGLLAGAALALDRLFPPDLSRAKTLSAELDDASGQALNLHSTPDGAIRLAPETVGEDLVPLLLAREDRRFWQHPGVDPLALLRAAGQLAWRGRVISGGSTIAMQVARLLEPHPRTLRGKLHDLVRAVQLEAHLGRAGVLRLYLTLAPMGGNIEGVRAAALLYFGREPAGLTRAQAALLIGMPQSPAKRRPDQHPAAAWRGAARVLAAFGDTTSIAVVPVPRAPMPGLAQHLAAHFFAAHPVAPEPVAPGSIASGSVAARTSPVNRANRDVVVGTLAGVVDTTLDGALQAAAEALARREVGWIGADADVAALVVRNRDRAVLAYLGGVRFFAPGGMVDMVRAVRSPGSALKPFVYAMAFDAGLAAPGSWVDDDTLRIGTYAPRDFDRTEHGPVTAADALRQSLNRPAVRLLAQVGPARFAGMLRDAGAPLRLPRGGVPSAALALGGAGINLFDLAALYADLADGGVVGALHVTGAGLPPTRALVSRGAAVAVDAILRGQPAPQGVVADPGHPIAYKTGTSYGYRDAWACGFTPAYTVVVWVGRRDGSPRPGATGRDVAAPLLFRLFGLLPPEPPVHDADALAAAGPLAPALGRMTPSAKLLIVFPPSHVDLAFDPASPIDLRAAGGSPPYAWTADGVPVAATSARGNALWAAPGPGFAHLTVVDRDGHSASADVRVVGE